MNTPPGDNEPIVVIDDDEAMRRACQAALSRAGYQVETYADGPSGLQRIEEVGAALLEALFAEEVDPRGGGLVEVWGGTDEGIVVCAEEMGGGGVEVGEAAAEFLV